ncbi:hypothetical protein [Photobacterium sp. TY1-4]|uniref:hypothetical protein n=1 Tax=Photobacterium sp. TY1-4 TaxID=2899122 RepID=UPI0021C128EB|nr:hypothetical protein [Photobacterium sp. TY1-4]UXI03401.1 hypothetical protein NH461_23540 [Photobacterium sp. TY1-4]
MPSIFVKEFSAIATQGGTKKLTLIKRQKNKGPYHPSSDYYKSFREKIVDIIKNQKQLSELTKLPKTLNDKRKTSNYSLLAKKFVAWAKGKNIRWHDPVRNSYHSNVTEIVCNPELNVVIDGVEHIIKLYFSVNEPMTKERANYICYLMQSCIDINTAVYAVLDINTRKMYTFSGDPTVFSIAVESEIAAFERAWQQL